MSGFVNLHAHTEASIADGLFGPKKWVSALKEQGYKAHAVTDHGVMTSLLPFYHLMKKEKMIPIMGVEFYYVDEPTVKNPENRKSSHLILLAKNYEGWQNLCRLSHLSYTEGFYYKPRIGRDWLIEHREGLVCLSACQGGVLSQEVWGELYGREGLMGLEERFKLFRSIFGEDFYVEFQGHNTTTAHKESGDLFNSQELINQEFYDRLRGLDGFKQVVTNDCHYIAPEHAKIQKTLKEISWGSANNSAAGESATVTKDHFTDSLWLKKPVQVYEGFREHHEYLPKAFVADGMKNTVEILEKCKDFEFPEKRFLPAFRPTMDSKEIFKKLTHKKLVDFLKSDLLRADKDAYVERFKKEFRVISTYNLEDYFLIIWDLIRFADKKGIYTGLGRGSAAGCLISYLLDIVKIDPLEYDLIFERFLNENRCVSGELPDIDLDIESDRRAELKEYIYRTYGEDRVVEIGTYGRMKLKTSLIDFGKAMKVATNAELLKITTKLESDTLEEAAEESDALRKLLARHLDYTYAVEEIQGQIKSQGVHPAGVIICNEPIADITPLKTQNKTLKPEEVAPGGAKTMRLVTTQAEDKYLIAAGMMKADLLGLKEYDVVRYVIENAPGIPFTRENYVEYLMQKEREKSDKKVWKMFQEGRSEGVFQFASDGMKGLLRMMKPTHINDLIAANALFRPGCLENNWHIDYCRRKHGEEAVSYVHEDVKKALGSTYGVIVFQEQFMEVIHRLGGVSLVDSDTIRSALGKKDAEKLDKFRIQFVEGASKRIGRDKAEQLWTQIEKASGYTFNKSHSAAYSVLAYISQWLKTYYPAYFWAGQLDWDTRKNKLEDMLVNRRAASDMGVEFVTPHINKSKLRFTVDEDNNVVWSFSSIKGLGPKAAQELVEKQPYADFEDFFTRIHKGKVKYNIIQALIYCGAFDSFGDRREFLKILAERTKGKRYTKPSEEDLLRKFADTMGFFERKIKDLRGTFSERVFTEQQLREFDAGDYVKVGGMITKTRQITTKNGDKMGFATLMDLDELIELTFFPAQWAKYEKSIKEGAIVEVEGTKSGFREAENQVEVEKMEER